MPPNDPAIVPIATALLTVLSWLVQQQSKKRRQHTTDEFRTLDQAFNNQLVARLDSLEFRIERLEITTLNVSPNTPDEYQ